MLLDTLGFHGPHIMFLLTLTQIWKQTPYLLTFIGGFFVNKYINEWLKEVIREPRPEPLDLVREQSRDWIYQLRSQYFMNKLYGNEGTNRSQVARWTEISKVHEYGMPSGHAQAAGYILGYLYFVKSKMLNTSPITSSLSSTFIIISILCVITMYQRWESKAHSVLQIVVGVLLGILVSWIAYMGIHYYVSLPNFWRT